MNIAPEWIAFSEQLPEPNQSIIFTELCKAADKPPYVGIGTYYGEDQWNYFKTKSEQQKFETYGYMSDTHIIAGRAWHIADSNVVAWMPMPEPYTCAEPQESCSTCRYSPQTPPCDTCEGYSNWWPLD